MLMLKQGGTPENRFCEEAAYGLPLFSSEPGKAVGTDVEVRCVVLNHPEKRRIVLCAQAAEHGRTVHSDRLKANLRSLVQIQTLTQHDYMPARTEQPNGSLPLDAVGSHGSALALARRREAPTKTAAPDAEYMSP